jgi:hypothetical protein
LALIERCDASHRTCYNTMLMAESVCEKSSCRSMGILPMSRWAIPSTPLGTGLGLLCGEGILPLYWDIARPGRPRDTRTRCPRHGSGRNGRAILRRARCPRHDAISRTRGGLSVMAGLLWDVTMLYCHLYRVFVSTFKRFSLKRGVGVADICHTSSTTTFDIHLYHDLCQL